MSCDHYDFEGAAVLIPMVSSSGHGRASLKRLHYQEGKFAVGNILCAAFPRDRDTISARFLYEYLTAFKDELLVSQMVGTANVSLTLDKIGQVPIPIISPEALARLNQLMALCDQLETAQKEREARRDGLRAASLQRLTPSDGDGMSSPDDIRFFLDQSPRLITEPEHVVAVRQAILELAVRGRLVPQDPTDEPAAELLGRLRSRRGIAAARAAAKTSRPFDLPLGWTWCGFADLGTFGRGKSKHRPRNDPSLYIGGTYPFIQTGDVARSGGTIRTFTSRYNDVGLAQSAMWPAGTLCITIAANIADSGILAFDACFPDSVVGLVVSEEFPDSRYFDYFLRTAKAELLAFAPSTAQKNINLSILNEVVIPLPPLRELRRIVAKSDQMMAVCDDLERALATQQDQRIRLLEALLHEALEGAGVPESVQARAG
jgi:type I restriction enzyme S subunit